MFNHENNSYQRPYIVPINLWTYVCSVY